MKRSVKRSLLLAVLPLLLVGCESARKSIGWDVPEPRYAEAKEVQPQDIPAPEHFELQTRGKESSYLVEGRYRLAQLVYVGDGVRDDVVRFYREQMALPINGWTEESVEKSDRGVALQFVKGEYRCRVHVFRPHEEAPLRIDVELKTCL